MKISRKYIFSFLAVISLVLAFLIYNLWLKPWSIEGEWLSGPNDSFGLMPVKKEFRVIFGQTQFEFQGVVRPVKKYEYDLKNQLVILHTNDRYFKIRIVDNDTIRFNEGSGGVGLRIYHRND